MPHQVWINLSASAVLLVFCLFLLWLISLKVRDTSLIDIFWGLGFVLVSCVCLSLAPTRTAYIWLLGTLPIIWGLRLSLYLARRNIGHGEDYRYKTMQKRAEKKGQSEMSWRGRAFFTIFLGQGLLILIISAPIWWSVATAFNMPGASSGSWVMYPPLHTGSSNGILNISSFSHLNEIGSVYISVLSLIGALVWLIGFLFEAIGDWQLARFKARHKNYAGPYENKPILNSGLWKYTRHPNYFGNCLIWWGIWLVAASAPYGWAMIFAPILMTYLLVRVSGKDLLEKKMKTRKAYNDYIARTSGFFPLPPKK